MTLSDYLKLYGIGQSAFAEKVDVTQGRISQILRGSPVPPDLAVKIETASGGHVPRETSCPDIVRWATTPANDLPAAVDRRNNKRRQSDAAESRNGS